MISVLVPVWILGGAGVAMLVLNAMTGSGTSAMSTRTTELGSTAFPDARVAPDSRLASDARATRGTYS